MNKGEIKAPKISLSFSDILGSDNVIQAFDYFYNLVKIEVRFENIKSKLSKFT